MAHSLEHHTPHEENADGFFAAFTDLLVGLVFLLIIIIMSFGLEFKEQEEEYKKTNEEVLRMEDVRGDLLRVIAERMQLRGYHVLLDLQNGLIRLPEHLLFESGQWRVSDAGRKALGVLADVFVSVLPCAVSDSTAQGTSCEGIPRTSLLESILIEGHTDKEPFNAENMSNWELSAFRAIAVYRAIAEAQPLLETAIKNRKHEPVLGVSAYAERRPVDAGALQPNRRIDIRFNLHAPTISDVVEVY